MTPAALEKYTEWQQSEWNASVRVDPEDPSLVELAIKARDAYEATIASQENRAQLKMLLDKPGAATAAERVDLQAIDRLIRRVSGKSQQRARLAELELQQLHALYSFAYTVGETHPTAQQLRATLDTSTDVTARLDAWTALQDVGPYLKTDAGEIRDIRNKLAEGSGKPNLVALRAGEVGLSDADASKLLAKMNEDLRPLYRELHTWTRHHLAERYGQPVPDGLPVHWLPGTHGQDWSGIIPDPVAEAASFERAEDIATAAITFAGSIGLPPLGDDFLTRSSLYPPDPNSPLQKSPRPATFAVDLGEDVRVLASLRPDLASWRTAHREIAYAEAWLSASKAQKLPWRRIPAHPLVRDTAATWLALGATQPARLQAQRRISADKVPDPMQVLLHQALNYVVFVPFAGGTMAGFERAMYAEAEPMDTLNARYWDLAQHWQALSPPAPRSERWADALTRPQVVENPGSYALHALSVVAVFQLHEAAAAKVGADAWTVDLAEHKEVGAMLEALWAADLEGRPFPAAIQAATGAELSAQAMVRYFKPLHDWLVVQNVGRTNTVPNL